VEEVEQVVQERAGLVGCRRSGAATACTESSVAAGSAVAGCAAAPSVRGAAVAKGGAGACEAVGSGTSSVSGGLLGGCGGSGGSSRLGGGGGRGLCGRDSGAAGAGAKGSVAAGSAVVGGGTAVSVLRAAVTKGRTGAGLAGCTRAHTVGGDLASSGSGGRGRLGGRSSGGRRSRLGSGCGSLGAHGTVATAVAKGALAASSAVIGCGAAVSGGRAAVTERATQAGASRTLEQEDGDKVRSGLQLLGSSAGSVGSDSLGTGRSRGRRCTGRLENMVLDESRTGIRRKANASDEDGTGK
jgi:hypothetical protein